MGQPMYVKASQDLSSAALSMTIDFDFPIKLCQVLLHASTNITETVKVKFDSAEGSNYDVILDNTNLSSQSNYVFRPTGECKITAKDKIIVSCTNANTTGVVYVVAIVEPAR